MRPRRNIACTIWLWKSGNLDKIRCHPLHRRTPLPKARDAHSFRLLAKYVELFLWGRLLFNLRAPHGNISMTFEHRSSLSRLANITQSVSASTSCPTEPVPHRLLRKQNLTIIEISCPNSSQFTWYSFFKLEIRYSSPAAPGWRYWISGFKAYTNTEL